MEKLINLKDELFNEDINKSEIKSIQLKTIENGYIRYEIELDYKEEIEKEIEKLLKKDEKNIEFEKIEKFLKSYEIPLEKEQDIETNYLKKLEKSRNDNIKKILRKNENNFKYVILQNKLFDKIHEENYELSFNTRSEMLDFKNILEKFNIENDISQGYRATKDNKNILVIFTLKKYKIENFYKIKKELIEFKTNYKLEDILITDYVFEDQ